MDTEKPKKPDGLKSQKVSKARRSQKPDGLSTGRSQAQSQTVSRILEYFKVKDGVLHWRKEPHCRGVWLTDSPAGYQAVTQLRNRTYRGNILVNFEGKQRKAQDLAWVIYYGEEVPEGKRIIHLDGNKSNNKKENLHLQIKPGTQI